MTAAETSARLEPAGGSAAALFFRLFGWMMLGFTAAFCVSAYLTYWWGFPGPRQVFGGSRAGLAAVQIAIYAGFMLLGAVHALRNRARGLRADAAVISDINAYIIRAAFWAVLLVGLADTAISFLRVEGLLPALLGDDMATALGRSNFRGLYVHMPLIGAALVIAWFSRSLGFYWLALLVVAAELLIVIGRFIFSYEQAFMADLVRFWYAALFLFASAYTLLEEGHVRVDVLYTGFSRRVKGLLNASGTLLFGIPLCWVILTIGAGSRQSIIVSPLLSFEVTQAGFGMYVKYLMAAFLAVFAVTMLIQFVSYLLDAVADIRGEPGGRDHDSHATP